MLCLKGIGEKWEVGFTEEKQGRVLQRETEGKGINNTSDVWKATGKLLEYELKEQRTTH